MGKSTNFIGQPILNQLLFYIRGVNIKRIAKKYDAERYIKKFNTGQHLIVMLFGAIEGITQ
jgi:archaellum component FlaD/FlaE